MKELLFICTGNTCRSPMAEGLLRRLLGSNSEWAVASAGLCAAEGMPAASNAIRAMREIGVDLSSHRAQRLTPGMIERADLLVVMTSGHREAIVRSHPDCANKVFLLNEFGTAQYPTDVYDPVGESLEVYCRVRDEIDAAMPDLILTLMEPGAATPQPK